MDYQLWKEWEREQGKCNTYESFTCTSIWDFFFWASAKFKWILFKYYSILHVLRVLKCNLLNLFLKKKTFEDK